MAHALLIPFPFQGHVTPFVHLAIKLATKGFIITFINTQSIHHQISQANSVAHGGDIFAGARESGLDIRYATFSDGFPLEFDRKLHEEQYTESILNNFYGHVDKVVGEIVSGAKPPVSCLVADTFYVWPSVVSKKYGLVNVSFWTEPALVLSLYYHLDILRKNGHFGMKDNRKDTIDYIPGVRAINPTDLMSFLQDTDIWTVIHRIIYKAFDDVKRADIIVCNTVQELELEAISALHQKQPTYATGPIFPIRFTKSTVPTSLWPVSDCTHWLNTRPKGSVLYVSFGSLAHTSQHDIVEIAHGLLLSGVGFVWVLRHNLVSSDDSDFLPVGFEENVKDRGVILPWCSQIDVISHPAIGGFLTHCGWNSILESVWCGIPLLCAPLMTDQFTNRKLVVDDWKVGLNLCDNTPITREEVTNKINYLMCEKTSNELRKEIRKVRKTLEDALATNGSSERNFNQFIEDVRVKVNKLNGIAMVTKCGKKKKLYALLSLCAIMVIM